MRPGSPGRETTGGDYTAASDYRADIDGLRAVAVVPVVAFHAFPTLVPGGFVGVDIFFVISGFLITGILVDRLADGRFGYLDFYARRIRRIFPALIVVLGVVWLAGWARLYSDEFRALGRHVVAGTAFVSNLALRAESGYFDAAADGKPLLHLWSLAIEEQFYIAWPLLLAVAFRRVGRRHAMAILTTAVAAASFAWGLAIIDDTPTAAFYSPFSRAWELMAGALLAQLVRARPAWFERGGTLRSCAGLALIAVAVAACGRWAPYPSWRALAPVLGAALLISAGPHAAVNRILLARPAAVWIGRISYPLYLWHWPPLAFLTIDAGESRSAAARIGCVAVAVVLAWATRRFIESPIRHDPDVRRWWRRLAGGMIVVALVGGTAVTNDGFAFRFGTRDAFAAQFDESLPDQRYRAKHDIDRLFHEECNFYDIPAWRRGASTNVPRPAIDPGCTTREAGTRRAVFLWGDSHVQHLNGGLRAALPTGVALMQVASSGCRAEIVETDEPHDGYCRHSNHEALAAIRRERPDVVLIAQQTNHDAARFRRIARLLRGAGVGQVIVVGPDPQWSPDLNRIVARDHWDATPDRLARGLDPRTLATERTLKGTLVADEPFVYVDLFDYLCDQRGCRTFVDGDREDGLMTFDYGHLTPHASQWLAQHLLAPIVMRALDRASEPSR